MKKILTLVFVLAVANLFAIMQAMNIGGRAIDIEQLQQTLDAAQRDGQEQYKYQLRAINDDISAYEAQQAKLAHDLDAKRISKGEYDIRMKQFDRRIETRQKDLESLNKNADKVAEVITNIVGQGATLFIDTMKDENTRRTQIAVAAASAAAGQEEKNRGELEIMREKIQALTSPEFMYRTGITVAASGAGLIITYYGAKFGSEYAQRFIGVPELARESSEQGWWATITSLFNEKPKATFGDIVLPAVIKESVERIAASTKIIAQYNATAPKDKQIPHRNILLYGPPGTGKTMIARAITKESGTPFKTIAGPTFSQYEAGEDVHQFNLLMDWAERVGATLFFDEVDSFLLKRELLDTRGRNLLTTFIARTGNKSNVKIFIATNRPKDLDSAVLSRMSERIRVGLPDLESRTTLLQQYLNKYYGQNNSLGYSISPEINESVLKILAQRLDKFSGREIEDIVGLIQEQLVVNQQKVITSAIINAAANEKIQQIRDVDSYEEEGFSASFDTPDKSTEE